MKHSYHFLRYDPHGIKNKLYRFIDKLHPRSIKDFYPITYSYKLDKNDYYLNLCNFLFKDFNIVNRFNVSV